MNINSIVTPTPSTPDAHLVDTLRLRISGLEAREIQSQDSINALRQRNAEQSVELYRFRREST